MQAKVGETYKLSLKKEALNCIENLLVRDEICIDKYELLSKVIELLDLESCLELGGGIRLQLTDTIKY